MSNLSASSGELLATQRVSIYTGEYMAQRVTRQCNRENFANGMYEFKWTMLSLYYDIQSKVYAYNGICEGHLKWNLCHPSVNDADSASQPLNVWLIEVRHFSAPKHFKRSTADKETPLLWKARPKTFQNFFGKKIPPICKCLIPIMPTDFISIELQGVGILTEEGSG